MNYLFAPNEERAEHFLRDNRFGVGRYEVQIRLAYNNRWVGEKYNDWDTVYVLDDCTPEQLTTLQHNVARSPGTPRLISVEER